MTDHDNSQTWEELAARAQDGDRRAYERLLKEIAPFVRRVAGPSLANDEWTEDVVQDVLISVHKSLHTYSPERPFKPWLSAIIQFRKTDFLRRHYSARGHEQTSMDDADFIREHVTNPAHAGELKDMEAALDTLPDKQRRVFTLMRIEGYSAREVADRMDMSESAVKVSVHRTTLKLKEALEQDDTKEDKHG